MSISLKFNSGDAALLYAGRGLKPIRELGLHTEHEIRARVEAAVRATIEACAVDLGEEGFGLAAQFIRTADPAPIVARVLGDKP